MAKAAKGGSVTRIVKKKSSLGRHAKKDSPTKTSKNYKKAYRGQGK